MQRGHIAANFLRSFVSQTDSIFRFTFTLLFGITVAFCIGILTGLVWHPLQWIVFAVLGVYWVAVTASLALNKRNREALKLLAACRRWNREQLPEEFRFIEPHTKLGEIADRVGPYSLIVGEGSIQARQYNLPNHAAVLIFSDRPFDSEAGVRGVKFFSDRNDIPLVA